MRTGRKVAPIEPFEQIPATVRIAGRGPREAEARVDEPGKIEAGAVIVHHRGIEPTEWQTGCRRRYFVRPPDHHGPVGNLHRRAVDSGSPRHAEDVAVVNLGHRTMIAAPPAFDATADIPESAPTAQQTP